MRIFIALLMVVLLLPAGFAAAQDGGNINFGKLTIIPSLALEAVYDSNIYKGSGNSTTVYTNPAQQAQYGREEQVVSDWIYHIKPGILANFVIPERGTISFGWQLDRAYYNTQTNNNFQNNGGGLNIDYRAPEGILFGFQEQYQYANDPYGNADQYGVGQNTERYTNDVGGKLGYQLGASFRPIVYYDYFIQQYSKYTDWAQNYGQTSAGIGLEGRVAPSTWMFVRYMNITKNYIDNNDPTTTKGNSKTNQAMIGAGWDPGAKLSGEVNFGYQWRRYDNEFVNSNNTGVRREEMNSWIAATNVNFIPFEKTILGASIWRTIRDSGSNTNENFYDTGIGLNLSHNFYSKFTFKLGGSYASNDYNVAPTGSPTVANLDKKRRDDNWNANVGFGYDIQKWCNLGIGYTFMEKNSNYIENNYLDHQFNVALKLAY